MPGNDQLSIDLLIKEVREVRQLGIQSIILFGIPDHKDATGSDAVNEKGIIQRAVMAVKEAVNRSYGKDAVEVPSILRFGSWIGGDRDGNPNVTAEITREAILTQHVTILTAYLQRVERLIGILTQSINFCSPSPAFLTSLRDDDAYRESFDKEWPARFDAEPYRRKLYVIALRLNQLERRGRAWVEGRPWNPEVVGYQDELALVRDLELIRDSLISHGDADTRPIRYA